MPFDVATWSSVATLIVTIIAAFSPDRRKRTEAQQDALLAVSEAYHKTAAYLEFRATHGTDREREWEIAEKWQKAAVLLLTYDRELRERIGMKSKFWEEGGTWDPKAIKKAGIGLPTIWREVNARLGPESSPPPDDSDPSEADSIIRFLCPSCGK